jgi:hypothetical protein
MPSLDPVLAHFPNCSSELRIFGRQVRHMKWELPDRIVRTFSSAKSEKESRIVPQLLARPRRFPKFRQSNLKLGKNLLTFIAFRPINHIQRDCIENRISLCGHFAE